ncbi:SGNH/GDSL hydrolase family protein [Candidatus Omnitrophota bacterium]
MKKNIILCIIALILFYGIAETSVSLFNFDLNLPRYFKFADRFQVDPGFSGGFFKKDSRVFWRVNKDKSADINSQGFRDSKEIDSFKRKDTFRIVCIGDSVTFGVPITLNRSRDTFPKLLEKSLNQLQMRKNFEVINAGVPGFTSYQGLQYLKYYLIKYKPDLVISQFEINDAAEALYFADKDQKLQPDWSIAAQNFLNKSKSYRLLGKIIFYVKYRFFCNADNCKGNKKRVTPDDYKNNLREMIEIGKENGFKVIFLPPVFFEPTEKELEGRISTNKKYSFPKEALYVDTYSAFKKREAIARSLFFDDCHLTPEGHKILAEEILKHLTEATLLSNNFSHPSNLRVPIIEDEEKIKKASGKINARKLLDEYEQDIMYFTAISEVARKKGDVLAILRPSTRKIFETLIETPGDDLQKVVNFDEKLFFEVHTALRSKWGIEFIKENPLLVNEKLEISDSNKTTVLLFRIMQACAFKRLNLPEDEINTLQQYIILSYDSLKIADEKTAKAKYLLKAKKPQPDKKLIDKYQSVFYDMYVTTIKYMGKRANENMFGYGDSTVLTGYIFGSFGMGSYIEEYKLIHIMAMMEAYGGVYELLRGNPERAIEQFKTALRSEDFDPKIIRLIQEELRWMHENNLDGAEEAIEGINNFLGSLYLKDVTLLTLKEKIEWKDEWGNLSTNAVKAAEKYMLEWETTEEEDDLLVFDKFLPGAKFQMQLGNDNITLPSPEAIEIFQATCKINFDWGACMIVTPYPIVHGLMEYIIRTDHEKAYLAAVIDRAIELLDEDLKVKCINKIFKVTYIKKEFLNNFARLVGVKFLALLKNLDEKSLGFIMNNYYLDKRHYEKYIFDEVLDKKPGTIRYLDPGTLQWLGIPQDINLDKNRIINASS